MSRKNYKIHTIGERGDLSHVFSLAYNERMKNNGLTIVVQKKRKFSTIKYDYDYNSEKDVLCLKMLRYGKLIDDNIEKLFQSINGSKFKVMGMSGLINNIPVNESLKIARSICNIYSSYIDFDTSPIGKSKIELLEEKGVFIDETICFIEMSTNALKFLLNSRTNKDLIDFTPINMERIKKFNIDVQRRLILKKIDLPAYTGVEPGIVIYLEGTPVKQLEIIDEYVSASINLYIYGTRPLKWDLRLKLSDNEVQELTNTGILKI